MSPDSRTIWALGLSLVMWLPAALGMLSGRTDILMGGLFYLASLAIAWVGTGVIVNITSGYRRSINEVERAKAQIELLERRAAMEQQRRSTDKPEDRSTRSGDDLPPNV